MDRDTFVMEGLKNMQELIRFMDQKAGAAFLFCSLTLTVFVEISKRLQFSGHPNLIGIVSLISGSIFLIILLWEYHTLIIRIVRPRLARHYGDGNTSTFYFEHIAKMKKEEYVQAISTCEITSEIVHQSYEVASALNEKINRLSSAIKGLYFMVVALMAFAISALSL
jgi:hypothetical protein